MGIKEDIEEIADVIIHQIDIDDEVANRVKVWLNSSDCLLNEPDLDDMEKTKNFN